MMEKLKNVSLLFLISVIALSGCEKDEIVKKEVSPEPTIEELRSALAAEEDPELMDARTAAPVLQLSGYYSGYGAYFVSGVMDRHECVPSYCTIYVYYNIYNYSEKKWTSLGSLNGKCFDGDNLNRITAYYRPPVEHDFRIALVGSVRIYNNLTGQIISSVSYVSNSLSLEWPDRP